MNGRRDRILVPSAVALIAIGATLWLSSGGARNPTDWFNGLSDAWLGFLVGAGIVTVGIGYLCNALFTLWMLRRESCRFVDFARLMSAFGLRIMDARRRKVIVGQLHERLLDEFHLRFHSHAPQSLIDHCSRRNTAWYVAKTSALASIAGWLVAVAMTFGGRCHVDTISCTEITGVVLSFAVFAIVIPGTLNWQGTKWNREFWGVCWKWIAWDLQSHQPPSDWLGVLPEGVEWLPKSDRA